MQTLKPLLSSALVVIALFSRCLSFNGVARTVLSTLREEFPSLKELRRGGGDIVVCLRARLLHHQLLFVCGAYSKAVDDG